MSKKKVKITTPTGDSHLVIETPPRARKPKVPKPVPTASQTAGNILKEMGFTKKAQQSLSQPKVDRFGETNTERAFRLGGKKKERELQRRLTGRRIRMTPGRIGLIGALLGWAGDKIYSGAKEFVQNSKITETDSEITIGNMRFTKPPPRLKNQPKINLKPKNF